MEVHTLNCFCLPFDLTHQCRSDLSLVFFFLVQKKFGFPYFFLYSWRILLFSLTSGTSLSFLSFLYFLSSNSIFHNFRYIPPNIPKYYNPSIMAFSGKAPYALDYASYNWIGAPANYDLSTNADLGGDSRMRLSCLVKGMMV